jgi:oligoribonuclease (3'-5' exoribonuclease)
MATELPHLIWIDCEMTGLDLAKDALVEIAVLVYANVRLTALSKQKP